MKFEKGSTSKAGITAKNWIADNLKEFNEILTIGLPEYDDRLNVWRIPLRIKNSSNELLGEIKVDLDLTTIREHTDKDLIINRIKKSDFVMAMEGRKKPSRSIFFPTPVPNKIILGDSIKVLEEFPKDAVQLIFTSPPYFNAKPEYSEYLDYQEYLDFLRKVIVRCHAILSEGRFFVINISPILIKRVSRNTSSKRLPLPFDIHKILDSAGFEFIDDIFWVKPEGAGWNLGRGRRFAADRQPLQYKPVPVTEYILVYRKRTDKLIDWNIRKHHNQSLVEESKILGDYDVTNLWHIHPSSSKIHPATFPEDLVEKVIRYYSFKDDMVLDPFAGTGTVGRVAFKLKRRFLLVDNEAKYFQYMKDTIQELMPSDVRVDYEIHEEFKNINND